MAEEGGRQPRARALAALALPCPVGQGSPVDPASSRPPRAPRAAANRSRATRQRATGLWCPPKRLGRGAGCAEARGPCRIPRDSGRDSGRAPGLCQGPPPPLSHCLPHTLTLSLTLTHTLSHTLTHSLTHSLTLSHTPGYPETSWRAGCGPRSNAAAGWLG